GAPRMHERPLGTLLRALEELGAGIACEAAPGCAPVLLEARGLNGGEIVLSMDESSQYLSGLLLAAPLCRSALRVVIGGRKAVSWPYISLTLQTLVAFGIAFSVEQLKDGSWAECDFRALASPKPGEVRISVVPGAYRAGEHHVEGDWSGASCLLAAGAVGAKPIYVQGLCADSAQGDRVIVDILRSMGALVAKEPDGVSVSPSALHGVDVNMGDCPDLVPAVAALAAFASGETRIRGVAHLRLKESDRISAPAMELRKMGIRVDEKDDGLVIYGRGEAPDPSGCLFEAHNDHRIAMSLALFGLHGRQVALDHPETVRKSFPAFWDVWEQVRCPSEK
ncbi:MAG: 3-phosphoshikimate 1-carboxyvinyltransferase, partial [Desulfovibrionaceae bacterium]|nr:3-phosphoshikimate 1-carboxyvinyltransferase [Desulfovibrionaceae bacterium]